MGRGRRRGCGRSDWRISSLRVLQTRERKEALLFEKRSKNFCLFGDYRLIAERRGNFARTMNGVGRPRDRARHPAAGRRRRGRHRGHREHRAAIAGLPAVRPRAAAPAPGSRATWCRRAGSARLADQLGSFSAELVHPAAALAMDDPLALAMLTAACAVADGALPEREPHPAMFDGLLHLIAAPPGRRGDAGRTDPLGGRAARRPRLRPRSVALRRHRRDAEASPSSRRAPAAPSPPTPPANWQARLLRLPAFLLGQNPSEPADWRDGLRLTGHFLARDVFGHQHRPLPAARQLPVRPCLPALLTTSTDYAPWLTMFAGHDRGHAAGRRAVRALSRLRAVHHHVALAAGCARRAEAGASPADLRHAPAAARSRPPASRNAPAWSAT